METKTTSSGKKLKEYVIHATEYQAKLLTADLTQYRTLLGIAGEQGGKSLIGAFWLHKQIDKWNKQPANFVVGAPTYKVMEQSTRPTFMRFASGLIGKYDGKDDAFRLRSGGSVYFRSSTDPDSVVGIPDCAAGWVDEAGKCSRMFFYNVQGRCARLQGAVMLTSTPYALNYLLRDLIEPAERGLRKDILYVRWRSCDNPAYPNEEYERMRAILPARIFKMRMEGIHDKAEGLIHEHWNADNWVEPFQLPAGTEYYGGIDWGYDHPFACVVRAITPEKDVYTVSIFKKPGLSTSQQLELIQSKTALFHVKLWGCGHDRPDMIAELQSRGIAAVKYFEYQPNYREVISGDAKHSELIKSKQYRAFKGIEQWQDLEDEYQTYVWDKDDLKDERKRERAVDQNNDLMAAERYATCITMHLLGRRVEIPKIPLSASEHRDYWTPKKAAKKSTHWSAE